MHRVRALCVAECRGNQSSRSPSEWGLSGNYSSGTILGHSGGKLGKEIIPYHHEPMRFYARVGLAGLRFGLSHSSPSLVVVVGGFIWEMRKGILSLVIGTGLIEEGQDPARPICLLGSIFGY